MRGRVTRTSSCIVLGLCLSVSACGQTVISIEDAPPSEPDVDVERDLLAYWPFEETEAGMTVLDASRHGHDGTPTTPPPTPSVSVPPVGFPNSRSLSFDGATLVDFGNPGTLNVEGNVTLSAWIRAVSVDGYRNIVVHGFRWSPHRELALRIVDGDYEFTAWNAIDHMVTAPVPEGDLDSWHHVAGVFDGSSYRLYRDGELLAEHPDTYEPTTMDANWSVGGRSTQTPPEDRFFEGLIDEVRVYGRALSDEEVRALFRR